MRKLPDEIVGAIPDLMKAYPGGPIAAEVATFIAADVPNTRAAMEALESEGRAKIARRGRGLHLVPIDYPVKICPICRAEHEPPPKSKRITCSRSCANAMSWRRPGVKEQRVATLVAQRRSPEGRANTAERNRIRWSDPAQHALLSEQNRKRWADPYQNAKQAVAIQRVNAMPEKRELQRQRIKARWDDPVGREKLVGGIRKSKSTPEARAKFSKLLKERWEDPVWRAKYTAANIERNRKRAEQAKQKRESKA